MKIIKLLILLILICLILFFSLFSSFNPIINFFINITFSSLSFYVAFAFIAIGLIYIFYLTFFLFSDLIDSLGVYQKIDKNNTKERWENFKRIFRAYLLLSLPTYLTVLNLLHPSKEDLFKAFVATLPIIISYLVSLRLLLNPNQVVLRKLGIRDPSHLTEPDETWIKNFKERVHSFYFSLTEITIFYISMLILFTAIKNESITNLLDEFFPQMSFFIATVFVISYILALFVAAALGEYFLERFQPIEPKS